MKLFLKRNISAPMSAFSVFDELGNLKYNADFQKTSPIVKIILTDSENNKLITIRRLIATDVCVYTLRQKGKKNVSLVIKHNKDGVLCFLYGINRHICGDILHKNFKIIDVDNTVLAKHQRILSDSRESYELEIADSTDELVCVAAAVCIDLVNIVDSPVTQAV